MGSFSIWHLLILLLVVVLIFGTAKLPRAMGDLALGIKSFKKGMAEKPEETPAAGANRTIEGQVSVEPSAAKDKATQS
ncbi:MAG TPA: twin-arginine translocase TatA/TatE family subunit [Candidatus Sulfotelmatobacter sp.]|nr:twin-arginine translocase TatA/TatE family subunit [Candidatus Sulfotelmatobacter sp.]